VKTERTTISFIHAIGSAAYKWRGSTEFEVSNPFSHHCLLINILQKAEKMWRCGIKTVCRNKIFPPSPIVVMDPREKLEGGIADVECCMFRELALGAGARAVHLHIGQELSSEDSGEKATHR
jgi:rod shape-determining protein MreB